MLMLPLLLLLLLLPLLRLMACAIVLAGPDATDADFVTAPPFLRGAATSSSSSSSPLSVSAASVRPLATPHRETVGGRAPRLAADFAHFAHSPSWVPAMTLGPASTPPTIATGAAATAGAAAIGSAPKAPAPPPPGPPAPAPPAPARTRAHVVVTSDEDDQDEHSVNERCGEHLADVAKGVQFDEEEADDALVPLPPPERCRELLAGGSLTGDALKQRNARIDEDLGRPFRRAHPAEGLLAMQSQKRDAVAARRALLLEVQLHVVRLARLAGVGPCASYLDFGKARGPTGAASGTLWTVAAACLSHVPALSDLLKVKGAFTNSFPSGLQAAPEWSSTAGLAAAALLERELLARFDGEAFTTANPIADVRRAHLPVLLHWTWAQLKAHAASAEVARRCPEMVACLRSGRTAEGLAQRDVQRSGWHAAEGQAVMLDRATQATALGVQTSLGAPPHYALALAALGPLRTPSDVAELGGETARLHTASATGRLVLGRLLGVTTYCLADALKSLWKRAHFASVPLVTAASAGLGTVRRLLTLDEPGWEEMLRTILRGLLQERRRLQMPTATALAAGSVGSSSVGLSSSSSSSAAAAAAAEALLPLALRAMADFEVALRELPHAPAIKHVPYAAREGALTGTSEREVHHAAGRETMAALAGRGFGALRAAVADRTVRLPHASRLVDAVPAIGLDGSRARPEARIADVGEAAALAAELGLNEHGAVEHAGLACALLKFVRVVHLEMIITLAGDGGDGGGGGGGGGADDGDGADEPPVMAAARAVLVRIAVSVSVLWGAAAPTRGGGEGGVGRGDLRIAARTLGVQLLQMLTMALVPCLPTRC